MSIVTKQVAMVEMEVLVKKAKHVYLWIDQEKYCRPFVRADRETFVKNICQGVDQYDYTFHIDPDYDETIYVDKITRVPKQPAGETVDTPGPNLAP